MAVLSGAKKVCKEYSPATIFEISPGTKNYNFSAHMLDSFFQTLDGYSYFTVKGEPFDIRVANDCVKSHFDVVAIPKLRETRFKWFMDKLKLGEIDNFWDS